MILEKINVPLDKQRIVFGGKQLLDDNKVTDYGNLFDRVIALLFEEDPININFETNTDEYESEAILIMQKLKDLRSQDELIDHIHGVFIRMFDVTSAGPRENYDKIGAEIWKLWQERKKFVSP